MFPVRKRLPNFLSISLESFHDHEHDDHVHSDIDRNTNGSLVIFSLVTLVSQKTTWIMIQALHMYTSYEFSQLVSEKSSIYLSVYVCFHTEDSIFVKHARIISSFKYLILLHECSGNIRVAGPPWTGCDS